jgi:dTDP-4-dehydrorhamnose reductase
VGLARATGTDFGRGVSLAELQALLEPLDPVLLINAAAVTDLAWCEANPVPTWALHAQLPGVLANWTRQTGTPWVQVSTDHYFSEMQNVLHDEAAPPLPPNEYARSKLAGETMALTNPQALVIRTNIVGRRGWHGRPNFAEWLDARLRSGESFAAYTDVWASSMTASQCAQLLLALANSGARGLLNLAAATAISKAEFVDMYAAAAGLPSAGAVPQARPQQPLDGIPRANALGLDTTHAQTLLTPLGLRVPKAEEVAAALALEFLE